MTEPELARKLASLDAENQSLLIEKDIFFDRLALAEELKKLCYEAWLTDSETTKRIISAFNSLSKNFSDPDIEAFALWSSGIGEILNGQMRSAVEFFDRSAAKFSSLNRTVAAAETQVGKLYALAVLGLYDEAIECGLNAREVFLQNNETLAAGKIEHNLGNIYQRRDHYEKAEKFLRLARSRFDETVEISRLIQSDNSLANALAHQHKFAEAEMIYERALKTAIGENLEVTRAEIESNLGHLLVFQGRLDRALKHFESSRRRYEKLNLPHQTAIAEQEIADAYLELNLAPEASAIYERVTKIFSELGMKAEQAGTLANFARALSMLGETSKTHRLLADSQKIYADEKNFVGEATVKFAEAKLFHAEQNYLAAFEKASSAESIFSNTKFFSRALHARWLRGETLRLLGKNETARKILLTALDESNERLIPQIVLLCSTSLGQIETAEKNFSRAETYFSDAINLVEEMRAPLPAEDFRAAFFADKLTPYNELVRLFLKQNEVEKAFILAENARSKVLLEMLDINLTDGNFDESKRDLKGMIRVEKLRNELNWLYSKLNRLTFEADFDASKSEGFQRQISQRENEMLELNRKQNIFAKNFTSAQNDNFDLETLQKNIDKDSALIEFLIVDGKISAFIVTKNEIKSSENFADEKAVFENLENLRFQIDAMKSTAARKSKFQKQMIARTQKYLSALYNLIFKPLENLIAARKLVIVPHGILHYVPFHALFDGLRYKIETCEISYAPSAKIFLHCLKKRKNVFDRAVLIGIEDELTPNVRREVETLSGIFSDAQILIDEAATFENIQRKSEKADILHFACHGKFRPDNPLFSTLQLYGNWLNVRDTYALNLNASLVVLSACETGVSKIAAGDELLGFSRGFLSAGASSLVLSLWQVDDQATAELMSLFYKKLRDGSTSAEGLRFAQIEIMQISPHPFFWSPFVLIGCS